MCQYLRTVRAHVIVLNLTPYIVYVYIGCFKSSVTLLKMLLAPLFGVVDGSYAIR
jgi:hypothetical protein